MVSLQLVNFLFSLSSFMIFFFFYVHFMISCTKGSRPYATGEMNSAQYGAIVGQVNLAHQPPMVRI